MGVVQLRLVSSPDIDLDVPISGVAEERNESLDVQVGLAVATAGDLPATQDTLDTEEVALLV
jgi:hypothetical protein